MGPGVHDGKRSVAGVWGRQREPAGDGRARAYNDGLADFIL